MRHAYEGSLNVLRHYGLLPGPVRPIAAEERRQRLIQAPDLRITGPARATGFGSRWPIRAHDVGAGQLIGRLHDFSDHSAAPWRFRAHRAGVLIARYSAAVCPKGLTLFVIGEETEFRE